MAITPKTKTSASTTQPKTTAAKKPTAKKVTTLGPEDLSTLTPGEKIDLKIKGKKAKIDQLKKQIYSLKDQLQSAKNIQKFDLANKIEGLIGNLAALEQTIEQEIKNLEQQAQDALMTPQIRKLLDTIRQRCAGYIQEYQKAGKYLYRGSKGPAEFIAKSWDTRKSKDSSSKAQELFDKMLAQQGFVALRGNSIFTTSRLSHASGFGARAYFIFPVDGLSHYSYTNRGDLVLDSVTDVGLDQTKMDQVVKQFKAALIAYKKTLKGYDKSNVTWIQDRLKWDPSYALHWLAVRKDDQDRDKYKIPDELWNLDISQFVSMDEFNKKYEPKHTNLAEALEKGREVYISGVYYALSYQKYKDVVQSVFGIKPEKW